MIDNIDNMLSIDNIENQIIILEGFENPIIKELLPRKNGNHGPSQGGACFASMRP